MISRSDHTHDEKLNTSTNRLKRGPEGQCQCKYYRLASQVLAGTLKLRAREIHDLILGCIYSIYHGVYDRVYRDDGWFQSSISYPTGWFGYFHMAMMGTSSHISLMMGELVDLDCRSSFMRHVPWITYIPRDVSGK